MKKKQYGIKSKFKVDNFHMNVESYFSISGSINYFPTADAFITKKSFENQATAIDQISSVRCIYNAIAISDYLNLILPLCIKETVQIEHSFCATTLIRFFARREQAFFQLVCIIPISIV